QLFQHPITVRDIAMRGAVKTIAADAMAPVEMIGNSVEVRMFRYGLVKGRVENSDLRGFSAEDLAGRANPLDVAGIVQRREVDTRLDPPQHLVIDQDRFLERLAAVHDSVAHSMDVRHALNLGQCQAVRRKPAENVSQGGGNVAKRRR